MQHLKPNLKSAFATNRYIPESLHTRIKIACGSEPSDLRAVS
jgi:hypothetical protein